MASGRSSFAQRAVSGTVESDPLVVPRDKENPRTFRAHSELVLVPVLVTRGGNHVPGLKKEQFTLQEEGKVRPIASFSEENPVPGATPAATLPSGRFSNTPQNPAAPHRLVIIALDYINSSVLERTRAREDTFRFLSGSLDVNQSIALLAITTSGIRVLHDFTQDVSKLQAALKKAPGGNSAFVDEANSGLKFNVKDPSVADLANNGAWTSASLEADKDSRAVIGIYQQRQAIEMTLNAMRQIASAFAGLPGRKSLLWVGSGFPFSGDPSGRFDLPLTTASFLSQYERTFNILATANISVYPMDGRGVVNVAHVGVDTDPLVEAAAVKAQGTNPIVVRQARMLNDAVDTFTAFSSATGGKPCYGTELKNCLAQAMSDGTSYYMLGYYLDRKNTKAGFRKLTVKVESKGVEVRARKGVFVPTEVPDSDDMRKNDIALALTSPLSYTGLALEGKWMAVADAPNGKRRVTFDLRLPGKDIFLDQEDRNHMNVQLVGMATNAAGERIGDFTQTIEGRLKPASVTTVRNEGIDYSNAFELPPGNYRVHFVARDNLTGKTGSVVTTLTVAQ